MLSAQGRSTDAASGIRVDTVPITPGDVRHPVTAEMENATNSKSLKNAPGYVVPDAEKNLVAIAPPHAARPQLVYFVLDGCPCSADAEPLFHDLAKRYQGKVDFVSVTDADPVKAKRWKDQQRVPYPVVPDPKKEIIRAYDAKSSVYSALVNKEGKILKMWPGYSTGILKEQNALMAKLAGVKELPFDTKYAPEKKTTGCAF